MASRPAAPAPPPTKGITATDARRRGLSMTGAAASPSGGDGAASRWTRAGSAIAPRSASRNDDASSPSCAKARIVAATWLSASRTRPLRASVASITSWARRSKGASCSQASRRRKVSSDASVARVASSPSKATCIAR